MNYKRLAQLSIGFVILIFFSQAYLIGRLFQVNHTYLGKVVNVITQEVYTKDMNFRLAQRSTLSQPIVELYHKGAKIDTTGAFEGGYNLDSMKGVDKSNRVSLLNIGIEMVLSKTNPMKLRAIDSLATILFKQEHIYIPFYSQIIDLKNDSILDCSRTDIKIKSSRWASIQSKYIPLNFTQDRVLQIVLQNPLKAIFKQMAGLLISSLLLSLFCIYCLFLLQRTLARQKKLAQSKNDFYNQVSHELKRPVSVVYQAIDSLLYTDAIENAERRKRYMELSIVELQRMTSKIDMILTMSLAEEGVFNLNKSSFNVIGLLKELEQRYQVGVSKPCNLIIKNELLQPIINADREHLFQCISNLIENAIKYSGESVQILLSLRESDDTIVLSVRDNGFGIHEKDLGRIFEKFERANIDKKLHGYGIGLSYVKQIIEMHGGVIQVKSEYGAWSEFTIQIPKKED